MTDSVVTILVGGDPAYARVARQAASSVLDHTDFELYVGHTFELGDRVPRSSRVTLLPLRTPARTHRAYRFLQKFELLAQVLDRTDRAFVIMLDADAVLVRRLSTGDLESALGACGIGMTEQTGIVGSAMARPDFLQHYAKHSLTFIEPEAEVPDLDHFRYYNSGVVLARRDELARLVDWALDHIAAATRDHQVGEHMIADQDYFQVWANTLHQGSCAELGWEWNHCELWDTGFPRDGLRIAHFSNFCAGPTQDTAERMRQLRVNGLRRRGLRRLLRSAR